MKKRELYLGILVLWFAVGVAQPGFGQEEPLLGDPGLAQMGAELTRVPGGIEGTGTHFRLTESEYLNITLESSEPVHLILESVPEMVTMHIESASDATSTEISLGGFAPQTTYHKYEDDYHNHIAFRTDAYGNYTYTQDLSDPHVIFIQPRSGTIFLTSTGWSEPVGTWDLVSKHINIAIFSSTCRAEDFH